MTRSSALGSTPAPPGRVSMSVRVPEHCSDRGSAVVEFAILSVLLTGLLVGIIHVGTLLWSYREVGAAVRIAGREVSLTGVNRRTDQDAVLLLRALLAQNRTRTIRSIVVYRAQPGAPDVPADCWLASVTGLCNNYPGAAVAGFTDQDFDDPTCRGDRDVAWCPTERTPGSIGVAVELAQSGFLGLVPGTTVFHQFAVFPSGGGS